MKGSSNYDSTKCSLAHRIVNTERQVSIKGLGSFHCAVCTEISRRVRSYDLLLKRS